MSRLPFNRKITFLRVLNYAKRYVTWRSFLTHINNPTQTDKIRVFLKWALDLYRLSSFDSRPWHFAVGISCHNNTPVVWRNSSGYLHFYLHEYCQQSIPVAHQPFGKNSCILPEVSEDLIYTKVLLNTMKSYNDSSQYNGI